MVRDLDGVFVYLDNIVVASSTVEEHTGHLHALFKRLQANGLVVCPEKCISRQSELTFLGQLVTPSSIKALPSCVAAIKEFPHPSTARDLRRFLGLLNFYHHFLPQATCTLHPLHQLCRACSSSHPLTWNADTDAAFMKAKELITSAVLLQHPTCGSRLHIVCDASENGAGAALEQLESGMWEPILFFSHHFSSAESKYGAFDWELLATYLAACKFQTFIEGCNCTLLTNHISP